MGTEARRRQTKDELVDTTAHVLAGILLIFPSTVALALNEQILDEGENIPVIEVEDGHNSGHRDIKPDLILWPEGEIYLDDLGNQ